MQERLKRAYKKDQLVRKLSKEKELRKDILTIIILRRSNWRIL